MTKFEAQEMLLNMSTTHLKQHKPNHHAFITAPGQTKTKIQKQKSNDKRQTEHTKRRPNGSSFSVPKSVAELAGDFQGAPLQETVGIARREQIQITTLVDSVIDIWASV